MLYHKLWISYSWSNYMSLAAHNITLSDYANMFIVKCHPDVTNGLISQPVFAFERKSVCVCIRLCSEIHEIHFGELSACECVYCVRNFSAAAPPQGWSVQLNYLLGYVDFSSPWCNDAVSISHSPFFDWTACFEKYFYWELFITDLN